MTTTPEKWIERILIDENNNEVKVEELFGEGIDSLENGIYKRTTMVYPGTFASTCYMVSVVMDYKTTKYIEEIKACELTRDPLIDEDGNLLVKYIKI